jgi:uncharacterized protein YxjI
MSEQTWSPPQTDVASAPTSQPKRPRRPKFGFVGLAAVALRFGRQGLDILARSKFGPAGAVALAVIAVAVVLGWRAMVVRKRAAQGGVEVSPDGLRQQFADSGLAAPAFASDGTILGSSILVVNQRTKLLEVNTAYDISDEDGGHLGSIEQIGQSKLRQFFRIVGAWDQYFTHHFDVLDNAGAIVLRITRPRKLFKTKVHIFDGNNHYLGSIMQQNVFGKIRFQLTDGAGNRHGELKAEKLHAWDFQLTDAAGRNTATVIKSWEGWARTTFTKADRYVVRIHRPLPSPMRELTVACALSVDLALKQDARSFG